MEPEIFLLKSKYNKKSSLDIAYKNHLNSIIDNIDEEQEARWETYSFIIETLNKEGKSNYFSELKYRLSDGENPNNIMIDIIERESEIMDGLYLVLKKRLEEYLDDDYFKQFYI